MTDAPSAVGPAGRLWSAEDHPRPLPGAWKIRSRCSWIRNQARHRPGKRSSSFSWWMMISGRIRRSIVFSSLLVMRFVKNRLTTGIFEQRDARLDLDFVHDALSTEEDGALVRHRDGGADLGALELRKLDDAGEACRGATTDGATTGGTGDQHVSEADVLVEVEAHGHRDVASIGADHALDVEDEALIDDVGLGIERARCVTGDRGEVGDVGDALGDRDPGPPDR